MSNENISVAIRMRPLNEREKSSGQEACFKCIAEQNSIVQLRDGKEIDGQYYQYDRVFDDSSSTESIYDYVGKDLVAGVVNGISGTIFAYGQTSSGKTFTMTDVTRLAAEGIFAHITENENRQFILKVSFVEIYNEVLRDLLTENMGQDSIINIREDPKRGVYCEATEFPITDFDTITKALKKGIAKRSVESTAMNENSSRSHTIFKLYVESREIPIPGVETDGAVLIASLNLVDLAGSESVRHTGAIGQRAKEGGKINQSLLSLSRVIHALSTPGAHVGFRDSKLTRLLQPSLSGEAKMSVVCCITPAERYLEETRSTLQFASRAKLVTTHAKVNEVLDEAAKIRRLERELNMLRDHHRLFMQGGPSATEVELMEKCDILRTEKELYKEKIDRLQRLMLSQRDLNELSIASENIDISNLPNSFEKTSTKRETWCASQAMRSSANIDDLKASAVSFPPLPAEDGHAIMVAKEFELKAQIREMCQKIENKEAEIHTLRIQLEENSQRSAAALDEAISKSGEEFCDMEDSLNSRIEGLTKERDDLFSTVSTLEAKVAEIDNALKSFDIDNEELRKTVQSLSVDNQVLNEEIEMLKESIASLGLQKQDLAKNVDELTADLESTISKSGELEETLVLKIDSLESAAIESDEKHKTEIVELTSQITDFQERVASITNEKEILEARLAEIDTTKLEITTLEESLSQAQTTIQENNSKIASLEADLRQMDEIIASMEQDINAQNESISELKESLCSRDDKIAALEAQVQNAELQLEDATSELYSVRNMQQKIAVDESNALERQVKELRVQLESANTVSLRFQQDIQDLQDTVTSLRHQIANFESEKASTIADLETKNASLQDSLNTNEQLMTENMATIQDLTTEISRLSGLVKTSVPPSASASQDMSAQENIKLYNALEKSKEDAAKNVEFLTSQLGAKDSELSKLMATVRDFEERAVRAEQMISSSLSRENQACGDEEAVKKRVNTLQTQVDLLKSEKESSEIKIKSLETELREIRASASVNDEKLQRELESCTKMIKTLQEGRHEASSMSDAIKALEAKVSLLKEEKATLDNSVSVLLEEKEALIRERESLQSKLHSINAAGGSSDLIEKLRREIATLEEDALISIKQLSDKDADMNDLQNRLKKTKEEASMIKDEWQRLDLSCKALEDDVISMKASISERDGRIAVLEEEISNIRSDGRVNEISSAMSPREEELHAEVENVQQQLAEVEAVCNDLNDELNAANKIVSDLQQRLLKADERDAALNDMISTMKIQRESLEHSCETLETEVKDLTKRLEKSTAERDEAKKSLKVFENGPTTCSIEEKNALIDELNTILEKNLDTEARLSAAESEVKNYKKQLSDYDKTSAKEQELVMEAANAEMETLRNLHQTRETSLLQKISELEDKIQESTAGNASTRLLLQQLQESQLELEEATTTGMKLQDELLAFRQAFDETVSVKDKRIAHLEQSKLTQDQMEKIKILKTERKKYHDDCKVLKKQLQQLKAAYDEREIAASSAQTTAGNSDSQVLKLKEMLRDCSKQLKEYEEERNGVFRLLERLGLDVSNADQSVSLNDDASVAEPDILEAVTKLGNAFTTLKYSSESQSGNNLRVAELENFLEKRTCELMEELSKKAALEKRLESAKTMSKLSKDEVLELKTELETQREKASLLQLELQEARLKAVSAVDSAVDSASSEMQSLMEENIELMKENKELRQELNAHKDQLQRNGMQMKKPPTPKKMVSPTITGVENKPLSVLNVEVSQIADKHSQMKTTTVTSESTSSTVTNDVMPSKTAGRTKVVAKPITTAPSSETEEPGECNQS